MKQFYETTDFKTMLLEGFALCEQNSLVLAELGWTIPMYLTPGEVNELLIDVSRSIDLIDNRFVQLYEADERAYFNKVAHGLLTRPKLLPWRVLIKQSISAYKRNHYAITIPALLTVCEGVIMLEQGNRIDLKKTIKNRVDELERSFSGSLTLIVWKNINRFFEELYKGSDFDGPRPWGLNRHWILHGRDTTQWIQADSIRLFQALDTICIHYQI